MKNQQKEKFLANKQGFTLIELLTVLAIIVIMVGTILVALSSQRQRANQSRALAQLSGTLQPIVMCLSDEGSIQTPVTANADICDISESYGKWPTLPDTFTTSYTQVNDSDSDQDFDDGEWGFYVSDGSAIICCNNRSNSCGQLDASDSCTFDKAMQ